MFPSFDHLSLKKRPQLMDPTEETVSQGKRIKTKKKLQMTEGKNLGRQHKENQVPHRILKRKMIHRRMATVTMSFLQLPLPSDIFKKFINLTAGNFIQIAPDRVPVWYKHLPPLCLA